jgi:soluble lytic murein transglycosylase
MPSPTATPRCPAGTAPSWRVALALAALAIGGLADAAEPISDWLDGIGSAAEALRAGDATGSLAAAERAHQALPQGHAGARVALAVGLAQLALGEPRLALEPLTAGLASVAAAEAQAPLRLALGQALLESGRASEAVEVVEQAASGQGATARRARWLQAQALLASGLVAQGVARLEPLLAIAPDDAEATAARLQLAGALRLLGRSTQAATLYRGLALEQPERPEGTAALQALARWSAAGGPAAALSGADRLVRAERLLARGRPAEALSEVDAAGATSPPAEPARAALQRALVLLALGRQEEAAALAELLAARAGPLAAQAGPLAAGQGLGLAAGQAAGIRRSASWVLARVASRAGRLEEATSAYARVASAPGGLPGLPEERWSELADEARYLAAWLWYDAGKLEHGARRLEALARAHPASRRADDARWFAAWARLRLGDQPGARRILARLERGPLGEAACYWQGRLATSPLDAAAFYRRAQATSPDGWYAALARARLAALGQDAGPDVVPAPLTPLALGQAPASGQLARAAALLGLGWRAPARVELEELLRRRATAAEAAPLAELASFAGEVDLSFRAARDHLGSTRRTGRWLYPEPLPTLAILASAAGVDPDLLRAVVRKESAFRPEARSAAGALGLTQLLPATADRLGVLSGLALDPSARLSAPETSVALGAQYLGLLLERFQVEAAALSAYNAGPVQAAAWTRAQAGQPLDEWVEGIPYKETRGYVKAVLAAREAYRRLGGLRPALDPTQLIPAPAPGASF